MLYVQGRMLPRKRCCVRVCVYVLCGVVYVPVSLTFVRSSDLSESIVLCALLIHLTTSRLHFYLNLPLAIALSGCRRCTEKEAGIIHGYHRYRELS